MFGAALFAKFKSREDGAQFSCRNSTFAPYLIQSALLPGIGSSIVELISLFFSVLFFKRLTNMLLVFQSSSNMLLKLVFLSEINSKKRS
jgi:hypothetical protein